MRSYESYSGSHFPSLKVLIVWTGGTKNLFWLVEGWLSSRNCYQIGVESGYPCLAENGPKGERKDLLDISRLGLVPSSWVISFQLHCSSQWKMNAPVKDSCALVKFSEPFVPSKHTKKKYRQFCCCFFFSDSSQLLIIMLSFYLKSWHQNFIHST